MGEKNCFYHYNRSAGIKCDNCGKTICEECKQIFQDDNIRNVTQQLCPFCYLDKYDGSIFIVIWLFTFIIGTSIASLSGGSIGFIVSLLVFVFILFIGILINTIRFGEKKKKAREIYKQALDTRLREISKRGKILVPKKEKDRTEIVTAVYCRFCGAPITYGKNTCEYCGMTWVWN